jgi:hypothetical protein
LVQEGQKLSFMEIQFNEDLLNCLGEQKLFKLTVVKLTSCRSLLLKPIVNYLDKKIFFQLLLLLTLNANSVV